MKRQDALRSLITAGRSREIRNYIGQRAAVAQQRYADIRGDQSLSDKARRYYLARQYLEIRDDMNGYLISEAEKVTRTDRDDAGRVFGVSGLSGDSASLVISRRDAADRVAAVETSAELSELLARATRTGDEVLARAVAERATEEQNVSVMNAFLEDRPRLQEAGERLWNAKRAQGADGFAMSMAIAELPPAELHGLSDGDVEVILDDPPTSTPRSSASAVGGAPIFDDTVLATVSNRL